jgi:hypothetical protein
MRSDKFRAIASAVMPSLDFSGSFHLDNIKFKLGARRRVMKNRIVHSILLQSHYHQ